MRNRLLYICIISLFYIGGISINLTDVREDYKITGFETSGYDGKAFHKYYIEVDSTYSVSDMKQLSIKLTSTEKYKSLDKTLLLLYMIGDKGYYLVEVKNLLRPHDSMEIRKL